MHAHLKNLLAKLKDAPPQCRWPTDTTRHIVFWRGIEMSVKHAEAEDTWELVNKDLLGLQNLVKMQMNLLKDLERRLAEIGPKYCFGNAD